MGKNKIKIEEVKIDRLKASEYNPRQATKKECEDLKKSIQKFGFVDPLIVNSAEERKEIIIGGHFRWRTAKELGIEKVPVVYVNIPDIEKEKELNLRLNKNTGSFDYNLLANFDENLLLEVGWTGKELDDIFLLNTDKKDLDEIPEVKETKIKIGDLFQIGNHRLFCADATKQKNIEKLMNGEKANLCLTDPPYNYDIKYESYDDKKKEIEYEKFIVSYYQIAKLFSKKIIVSVGLKNLKYYYKHFEPNWLIAWVKKNSRTRSKLRHYSVWEPILYENCEDAKAEVKDWDILWVDGKPIRPIKDFFECNIRIQPELDKHPCPKPISLWTELISKFTNRDTDIVLDVFGGTGTTMVASHSLKRKAYLCEIEPKYCEIILERMKKLYSELEIKKL